MKSIAALLNAWGITGIFKGFGLSDSWTQTSFFRFDGSSIMKKIGLGSIVLL
jgi:hypothetical protein